MAKKKFRVSRTTGNKLPVRNDQQSLQKALHSSADYFEKLLRARIYKAMLQIQKDTSINSLAMVMGNSRQAKDIIPRKRIEAALNAACKKVAVDCFMRGGKLGGQHVNEVV